MRHTNENLKALVEGGEFLDRAADRATRPGGVLEQDPGRASARRECLLQEGHGRGGGLVIFDGQVDEAGGAVDGDVQVPLAEDAVAVTQLPHRADGIVVSSCVSDPADVHARLSNGRTSTSAVEERMLVRCFSFVALTSRSSARAFSPTIMPS